MAPKPYTRGYSFSGFQANSPQKPLPGQKVDIELDDLGKAANDTMTALAKIQRSDGQLQNGIVTKDALSPEISSGVRPTDLWESGLYYEPGVTISYKNGLYRCVKAHVSTNFLDDDIEDGYWLKYAEFTPDFADQPTAEAGLDELQEMNALRTAQAIGAQVYPTSSDLELRDLPAAQVSVRTSGRSNSGDGGAAEFIRVGSEPAHDGKRQQPDGSWLELDASAGVRPEQLGRIGESVAEDAAAFAKAVSVMKAKGVPLLLMSGKRYRLGNTRLDSGWGASVDIRCDGPRSAIIDFSDATDWTGDAFTARTIISGTPDTANAQALTADCLSLPPVGVLSASYDSGTGLITMNTLTAHGRSTGDWVHVRFPSTAAVGQVAYFTEKPSNEARACDIPVQITVTGSSSFTYGPPHGGTPDAALTSPTSATVTAPDKFVRVASTSSFALDDMVLLRAENSIVGVVSGEATKPGVTALITRIIDGTWLQIDRPVPDDMPLLVANAAKIIRVPDAPIVRIDGVLFKGKGANLSGTADSGLFTMYCRHVSITNCQFAGFDFASTGAFSNYFTKYEDCIGSVDKTNEGGQASGAIPLQYVFGYGGSCADVVYEDCIANGGRHGIVEWASPSAHPYGMTDCVSIERPILNDQWSSNIATHDRLCGRIEISEARLNGGQGVNVRSGRATVHVAHARNVDYAIYVYGQCDNLKLTVDECENVRQQVVRVTPYATSARPHRSVGIEIGGASNCYGLLRVDPQQGAKGVAFHVKKVVGRNIYGVPIFFTGFSPANGATWTEVKFDYVDVDGWGPGGATLITLVNCPRSSIGAIRSKRYDGVNHTLVALSGQTADGFRISADIQADGGGGTIAKLSASAGTGHWAAGVLEAEALTPSSNTITPRFIHDHQIVINSTGTHPLTIAGLTRGKHMLRPASGTVTLQEGGNLQLDGSADKAVTNRTPIVVEWIPSGGSGEFVQVAKQIS